MASSKSASIALLEELIGEFQRVARIEGLFGLIVRTKVAISKIFDSQSKFLLEFEEIISALNPDALEEYVSAHSSGKITHLKVTGWESEQREIINLLRIMIDELKLVSARSIPTSSTFPQTFISYRRDDSSGHTGRLYDRLVSRIGERLVFFDISTTKPGDDFVKKITDSVSSCQLMFVIIGKQWLKLLIERIDKSDDYVRLEIAIALELNKRIVPVLVGGATMPSISELPRQIAGLAHLQAHEITDSRFHSDVDKLIDSIENS